MTTERSEIKAEPKEQTKQQRAQRY